MAVKKTYEVTGSAKMLTRHMKFMVEVPQGDKVVVVPRRITIKGHLRPKRRRGRFVTSEAALIKAIDQRIENAGVNTTIICVREEKIPDKEAEKTPEIVMTKSGETRFEDDVTPGEIMEATQVEESEPAKTSTVAPSIKEVPGISRVQDAKVWLLENIPNLTTREVTNKDMITRVAEKNNIKFIDLT